MPRKKERTLLTIDDAATQASVPLRTLYYAVKRDFIPHEKKYGRILVTLEDVEKWKADQRLHKPGRK